MGQQQREYSTNEATSLQQQLQFVLGQLKVRQPELEAVLPPDIPFERFHATVNQALRNNPEILRCTGVSIVNACVKAAYDGLRLDGKEAALVSHNVKVGKNPDRWEQQAEYFPMVRGLIKKILLSKKVIAIEVEAIHRNDRYRVVRGTNPEIHHEPLLDGDRGPMIAFYSVATLESGHRTAEFMTAADVAEVRKEAKTQFVWDRWPGEMGKKSVIRRHEKRLPSGRDMIDVEARELFPQFDRTDPHPQLAAPTPPRPTRQAALPQPEQELATDFGVRDRGEPVVAQRSDARGGLVSGQQAKPSPAEPTVELPEDEAAWSGWGVGLEEEIARTSPAAAVNTLFQREAARLEHAPRLIADRLRGQFTDRIATLATDPDAGAEAGGGNDSASAGEPK